MRKILHIDMDAFYASVEELDQPRYKKFPLVVGGSPESRGVVCSANYKAREFGIRSAMPCSKAYRLCPQAIFVKPSFSKYRKASEQVFEIFQKYTDLIEPLSLDEAWLDVTENKMKNPSGTWIAREIKQAVKEKTGLSCSAGVSFNKFLAKVASDWRKPDGLFVITPEEAEFFLRELELKKIPGVGEKFFLQLKNKGLTHGKHVLDLGLDGVLQIFPKRGADLYARLQGEDHREVKAQRSRKSISVETTFFEDRQADPTFFDELEYLIEELDRRCQRKGVHGNTVILKFKLSDFSTLSRSITPEGGIKDSDHLLSLCRERMEEYLRDSPGSRFRLLGVGLSNLVEEDEIQPSLFSHFSSV